MNRTKIEWCDYTVNPVQGYCPMACPYCYARRFYDRFHLDKTIRYDDSVWHTGEPIGKPTPGSRIFVGSTIELFGDWIEPEWLRMIFGYCRAYPQHTFIFLTKKPENLVHWVPWPDNAWVGTTMENGGCFDSRVAHLCKVEAKVRFISFEPLLGPIRFISFDDFIVREPDWIILGSMTGPGSSSHQPRQEWESLKTQDEKERSALASQLKELLKG